MDIKSEEWRDVVGWEGFYEVSDHGRVRSVSRDIVKKTRWGQVGVTRKAGRIIALGDNGNGYKNVMMCIHYQKNRRYVHRMVLEAFVGPCPEGMEARHMNGNKEDNSLSNLRWGTHLVNAWDKDRHGTMLYGKKIKQCKLSERDVVNIREAYAIGDHTQEELAAVYGVTQTNIGLMVRGTNWRRAGGPITKRGLGNGRRKPRDMKEASS